MPSNGDYKCNLDPISGKGIYEYRIKLAANATTWSQKKTAIQQDEYYQVTFIVAML